MFTIMDHLWKLLQVAPQDFKIYIQPFIFLFRHCGFPQHGSCLGLQILEESLQIEGQPKVPKFGNGVDTRKTPIQAIFTIYLGRALFSWKSSKFPVLLLRLYLKVWPMDSQPVSRNIPLWQHFHKNIVIARSRTHCIPDLLKR